MDNSNFFNNLELNNIINYNEIINNDLSPPNLINIIDNYNYSKIINYNDIVINNNNNLDEEDEDEDVEEVPDEAKASLGEAFPSEGKPSNE